MGWDRILKSISDNKDRCENWIAAVIWKWRVTFEGKFVFRKKNLQSHSNHKLAMRKRITLSFASHNFLFNSPFHLIPILLGIAKYFILKVRELLIHKSDELTVLYSFLHNILVEIQRLLHASREVLLFLALFLSHEKLIPQTFQNPFVDPRNSRVQQVCRMEG